MERFEQREKKRTQKKIEPKKWGGWSSVSFFSAGLRPFGAQAVHLLNVIFLPMLQASLTILESWTILDHFRLSWTILDHLGPYWIILNNIGPWHNFLAILDHFLTFPELFLTILDHFLTILDHFLKYPVRFLTIFDHFLTILDHILTFPDHFQDTPKISPR